MTAALPFPPLPEGAAISSAEYQKGRAFLAQVNARGKPPLQVDLWAWQMATVHIFFFELLERAYAFAPYAVANNDLENYLGFAEAALSQICEHHELEEIVFYPRLKECSGLDIWQVNVEEHKWFEDHLTAAWVWVRRCRENLHPKIPTPIPAPKGETEAHLEHFPELAKLQTFDADVFQAHIDAFILTLMTHMCHEIDTLEREHIEQVGEENLQKIFNEFEQYIQKHDPKWYLCSFIAGCDMGTLNSLAALPWFVQYLLVPFVFAPKYRAWWKYTPHPELLTFTGIVRARLAGEGQFKLDTRAKQD